MATRPSYEDQRGLEEVIRLMRERGFYLTDVSLVEQHPPLGVEKAL